MVTINTSFRFATLKDIETIIKARFDYFQAESWEVTKEMEIQIVENLKHLCQTELNKDFFVVFAEKGEELAAVAFIGISQKPASPFFPTGKSATVYNVLTYPKHRKNGYATKILTMLIEKAKENNVSSIELSASKQGKPVYEKLGFKQLEDNGFTAMKLLLNENKI